MRRFTAVFWALIAVMVAASGAFDDATSDLLSNAEYVTPREVEKLIDAGADVNAKDEEGNTALMLILWNGGKIQKDVINPKWKLLRLS